MRECVMKTHGARGVIESAKRERERERVGDAWRSTRSGTHTRLAGQQPLFN